MPNNRKYLITPSDWITYLQGEILSDLTIMLSLVAAIFLIVLSIMQMSIMTGDTSFIGRNGEMPSMTELAIEFGTLLIFVAFYVTILIRPKTKLCKRIIKGQLTEHKDILKEYEEKVEPKLNFLNRSKSKKSKKVKKTNRSRNAKQKLGDWENDPHFVKHKKK